MTEWREVKLSDLISIKHGYAFKGEFFSEEETPYILVTPGNFNIGGSFKSDKFKWYKGEIPTDYILKKDDLIVTMTDLSKNGDTLGYSALVPELNRKVLLHNQRIGLVEIKSQKIDKFFLYWLMRTSVYQKSIVNTASGSTVKHTSPDRVCQFSFLLPPLDVQKRIAGILGALDDRIDVLRRENVVLEQMAQAVFQSWFVDFDIVRAKAAGTPESEVCEKYHITPELYALFPSALTPDNLPLGWEKKNLGDEFKIVMGQSPAGDTYNENRKGMPFFQGRRDFGFRYPTNRVYCTAPTRFAEKGDVLVSVRAPVGDLNIATEKCCIGRGVASVRHLSNSTAYAFCQLKTLSNQFDVFNGDGTVFGCIGKDAFLALPFVSAPREVLEKTLPYLDSFENKIFSNTQQIRALSATRDALLPKLMNGEIEV